MEVNVVNNILLVFLNNLKDIEGFNKIIDEFDKREYKMYLYDNIRGTDFDFSQLPDIVEYYKKQHNNVNKIVILSNLRDLIFAWYRCYNSIVDDFIYFIDEEENNYFDFDDRHYGFYFNLFEFNNIESESIEGKIYLTQKNNTVLPIYFDPKYFRQFIYFDFNRRSAKNIVVKRYYYDSYEYNFVFADKKNIESIKLNKFNKRIVFIKGQSQYDVLRITTDYRTVFYKELGFEVDIIDLLKDNSSVIENKLVQQKPYFIYSANCIGVELKLTDGRNFYDALNIPFLGGLGDHPVNQLNRVISSPVKTLFTCIDKENIKYFKKHFPDKNIMMKYSVGYKSKNYKNIAFNHRKIDILFAGTLIEPSKIRKTWGSLDDMSKNLVEQLTEMAIISDGLINIDDEMTRLMVKYEINNRDINYRAYIHSIVERYIRYYKRYEIVKKLGESNLDVVCIGNADIYNKLNKSRKFIVKDRVSYQELLDLFNESKIVVNMTGHINNGITERIASAMINGAAAVTERNEFSKSNFVNGTHLILYDFNNLDDMINSIELHLSNLDRLEQIALTGQEIASEKFDFRHFMLRLPRLLRNLDKDFNKEIKVTKTYLPEIDKYKRYINKIFDNGQLTNDGEMVRKLEKKLAEYLEVKNLLLVSNGTLALQVAYKLLELKGEIITTPFSFVATTSSLVWEGLKPIFADINKKTLNIDVGEIEKKINNKTSAIVPVHVFGNGCDVEEISEIAHKYNLKVIYDAAHAFGIKYKGKNILSYGDISILSFHATKVFHTIEGGALIINDDELYRKAKKMINFGINEKGDVDCLGINAKMNEFQAAMGLCVLDDVGKIIESREKVHNFYINNVPKELQLQIHNENCSRNYAYFPVIFESEETLLKVRNELGKHNIYPRRYFFPSLDNLNFLESEDIRNSNDISKRIMCLPMSHDLSKEDILKIVSLLN